MTFTPPPVPQAVPPQKKGGCWKWGAIGCLLVLLLAVIGIGAIVMIVFGAIKSSDAYHRAVETAQKDPRVIAALGSPIHPGFVVKGNISVNASGGSADIEIPLIGPQGRAQMHAVATRSDGTWHYTELIVTPRNGPPIDLLAP